MRRQSALSLFPRRLAIALVLVLTIVVGSVVLVNVLVESKLASAARVELSLAASPDGGGGNYLMVGSDTRTFIENDEQTKAFGDQSDTGGQRSDTIMVLHTDPDSSRSLLVSFPRDLWVDVPGKGSGRINTAFNDGPQAVVDTLASNFDVPIHHYVEVNFESFRAIVDAIGTVPVLFPTAVRDEKSNLTIPFPGCAAVDGPTALAFVRSRNLELLNLETGKWEDADTIPDLGRIGRQQAFLREVGARAMDAAISNPFTGNEIADRAVEHLTVDQDFGRTDVFNLADGLAGDGEGAGGPEALTVPTEGVTRQGQEVLDPTDDNEALMQRLRDFDAVVADPSTVSPEDMTVKVLNASSVDGAAGKALAALKDVGFKTGGSGNADAALQSSEVHHPPGDEDKAALVASFVTGPVQIVVDDSVRGADVTLHIGKSFTGIATAAADAAEAPTVSLAPVPGGC